MSPADTASNSRVSDVRSMRPPECSATGWAAMLKGGNGARSLALAGGVALHATNVYVATTILPSVVSSIGGVDLYAWNTTLFVAASILGSAFAAKLLTAAGPRRAYLAAATLFAIGSAICGFAPLMWVMLAGRFVQGLGGGLLFALAYAMIRLVFDEALWPRAMALVSGMWGIATLFGPAIGGIFAEFGMWRAAFFVLLPVSALFGALAIAVLPKHGDDRETKSNLPIAQLFLLIGAVVAVSTGSLKPSIAFNAMGVGTGLGLAILLVAVERRAAHRLLPRGAFSLAHKLGPLYALMSLLAMSVTAIEIFVPLFLQVLHKQTPLAAGYFAALVAAGWTLGSIASASAQGRGVTIAIVVSPILTLAGTLVLAALVPDESNGSWHALAPICLGFILIGLGVGLAWPHLLTRVVQAGLDDEKDLAAASITTVQLSATAFGAALAGMAVNAGGLIDPGGLAGTKRAAFWLFGSYAAAPLIGIALALGIARASRPTDVRDKEPTEA